MTAELGRRARVERRIARCEAVIDAHIGLVLDAARASLESGWIAQTFSPLGARRHCAAVRRRVAAWIERGGGAMSAAIVGRRYLLTIDALAEEADSPRPSALRRKPPANDNGRGAPCGGPCGSRRGGRPS